MPKSWEPHKSYDPKCLELARYFLTTEPGSIDNEINRDELARIIQDAIEDFIWSKKN